MALEIIICEVERVPSVIKGDSVLQKTIFDLIMNYMIQIENEIDETWLTPKEGFNIHYKEEDDNRII